MLSRRNIRIKVFQAYYAFLTSGNSAEDVFKQLLEEEYKSLKTTVSNTSQPDTAADAQFLSELFLGTIRKAPDYEALILATLQNWDINRVATVDRIILMLALHEMISFADVPVKVSLNEYLDIAKQFSTDKSSQFVNGVLDAVYQKLKMENQIHKTGRGLVDPTAGTGNSLKRTV